MDNNCIETRLSAACHTQTDKMSADSATPTQSARPHNTFSCAQRRFALTLLLCCALFGSANSCGPGRGIGGPRNSRTLTPLVFKQHWPNMSEKNKGASGINEGVIRRDSPKFKELVPNYNKAIIFKDEEGSGADRLMTQRCKEKLNSLAYTVMNTWPGVRLRVTESWDEDNLHGTDSLHYEGRAVDITTSDRDRTKYGMLARLAVEAGFDWVYYESRAHIHCSVKTDAAQGSHVNGCFNRNSTVRTADGSRKRMDALAIGDRVLTMSANGESKYSEVIAFMDRQLQLEQEFVAITTEGGATLTVTPAHLVMVWNRAAARTEYRFADKVREGDFVFVAAATTTTTAAATTEDAAATAAPLQPQRVVKTRAVLQRGVVAPLTREGTIVVNDVAASCYAIVNSQTLAHWSLLPLRVMATLQSWLPTMTATSSKSTKRSSASTASQQNGIHWYAQTLYTLKDYVVPQSWRYQ